MNKFPSLFSLLICGYHQKNVLIFNHRRSMKTFIIRSIVSTFNFRRCIFSAVTVFPPKIYSFNKRFVSAATEETPCCDPYSDKRILYNCELRNGLREHKRLQKAQERRVTHLQSAPKSIFLRCVSPSIAETYEIDSDPQPENDPIIFPYQESEAYPVEINEAAPNIGTPEVGVGSSSEDDSHRDEHQSPDRILQRIRKLRERALREDFCGSPQEAALEAEELWVLNYGSEDENVELSGAICGGCGAVLHCRRAGWPGFVPAELLTALSPRQIRKNQLTCQRCYFLRHHNTPLHVSVAAVDYEVMISRATSQHCVILLLVDLLDFPGSVWPKLATLIGNKNPVIIAGNKVDLLPEDGPRFLSAVEDCLLSQLRRDGFDSLNVQGVHLISARNGFGVEDLISDLQHNWKDTDIFVVGATNAGKSSLFNSLLQSDMCRSAEYNLIQRATVSQWPGTTLNLLKFPLLRPMYYRLKRRHQRLLRLREQNLKEEQLRIQRLRVNPKRKFAMLSGHIGRTFTGEAAINGTASRIDLRQRRPGLKCFDENQPNTHWLMDTPGCVTDRQLLDLLTQEELLLTLSRDLLRPRTFTLYPAQSLFVGGLARVDFVSGAEAVRFTVFTSRHLPITVVATVDANDIYQQYLQSEMFVVPRGGADRMARWPGLHAVTQEVPIPVSSQRDRDQISCCDIVLSTAGWMAVTPVCPSDDTMKFVSHSPRPEGVCVRTPPLLPRAVGLRGSRIRGSPAHCSHKIYIPSSLGLPE